MTDDDRKNNFNKVHVDDIQDYAETTMNELLRWYGYEDKVDCSKYTQGLNLKRFSSNNKKNGDHHQQSSGESEFRSAPSSDDNSDEEKTDSPTLKNGFGNSSVTTTTTSEMLSKQHKKLLSALTRSSTVVDSDMTDVICNWCQKMGKKQYSLKTAKGTKVFCSEICFAQCRRASFKKSKICDWCKHVRHTVNYVDFEDGEQQLQFCSDKCLNQYKMNIFCKETEAHLQLHPHLLQESVEKSAKKKLITPELWLKNGGEKMSDDLESVAVATPRSVEERDDVLCRNHKRREMRSKNKTDLMPSSDLVGAVLPTNNKSPPSSSSSSTDSYGKNFGSSSSVRLGNVNGDAVAVKKEIVSMMTKNPVQSGRHRIDRLSMERGRPGYSETASRLPFLNSSVLLQTLTAPRAHNLTGSNLWRAGHPTGPFMMGQTHIRSERPPPFADVPRSRPSTSSVPPVLLLPYPVLVPIPVPIPIPLPLSDPEVAKIFNKGVDVDAVGVNGNDDERIARQVDGSGGTDVKNAEDDKIDDDDELVIDVGFETDGKKNNPVKRKTKQYGRNTAHKRKRRRKVTL